MVEASPPVNRRTLKDLTREAKRVDRGQRKVARKKLKNNGYSVLDSLRPDATAPSELYRGHEWRLSSVDSAGNRIGVGLSIGNERLKIEISAPKSQPQIVDIPLRSARRRDGEAMEQTGQTTDPLTEHTAQRAKKLLHELATSKR